MSTFSTERQLPALLPLALLALALAGCASRPAPSAGQAEDAVNVVKPVREQAAAPVAAASSAEHVTPVPHTVQAEQMAMQAAPDYFNGIQLMQGGKLDQAMVVFQDIGVRFPALSGPLVNQGLIYLKKQQYQDALDTADKALAVNGSNPYAWNLRGMSLRELGRFKEARAAYEKALALDPLYAKAHFNLGVLADLYLQDLPLALGHYEKYQALQKTPDTAVGNWITDLRNRLGMNTPPPAPAPAAAEAAPAGTEQAPAGDAAPADPQPAAEAAPAGAAG